MHRRSKEVGDVIDNNGSRIEERVYSLNDSERMAFFAGPTTYVNLRHVCTRTCNPGPTFFILFKKKKKRFSPSSSLLLCFYPFIFNKTDKTKNKQVKNTHFDTSINCNLRDSNLRLLNSNLRLLTCMNNYQ